MNYFSSLATRTFAASISFSKSASAAVSVHFIWISIFRRRENIGEKKFDVSKDVFEDLAEAQVCSRLNAAIRGEVFFAQWISHNYKDDGSQLHISRPWINLPWGEHTAMGAQKPVNMIDFWVLSTNFLIIFLRINRVLLAAWLCTCDWRGQRAQAAFSRFADAGLTRLQFSAGRPANYMYMYFLTRCEFPCRV